ncbi:hypothetical protein TVAG_125000 [Trichomonas vaginalis G3]|uniref:HEAT repeat family protein n=1 Tax=Trichomonas vaginalis (strain ATCC PRA-98 / G3) TaxID=412133 RepID=A2EIK6_TRIV3|nr:armadillo (ARM) repeat-containing protein family [Trichomonas vaginalis G3]EAY07527.1 hypothetical protein TVAG_125000 [Trichomonas vaginalis G3]KAI5550519.1 armadillo (ARM) repeat-containing protein family [Trichomonas vaginalis G3]|eukprot:XP_001319750.1 hypothetical protein [Trichomonas vaginalis G3]
MFGVEEYHPRFTNMNITLDCDFSSNPFSLIKKDEDIQLEIFEANILPMIKSAIRDDKKSMFASILDASHQIFEKFYDLGEHLMRTEIFSVIISTIQTGSQRKVLDITQLAEEICASIPSDYRDDFTTEIIEKYYSSQDPKLRYLTTRLIPIVCDSQNIFPYISALANDDHPNIRAAAILSISFINCQDSSLDKLLVDASEDTEICVQQSVASIIGSVAPHLVNVYKKFLVNQNTVRDAFPSFPNVVKANNFGQLYDAFVEAMKIDKNDAALALLETVKTADIDSEEYLYIKAASELMTFSPFAWRIHSFSERFQNKTDFLELLDPSRISDWRTRFAILKQCEEFVPELGSSLCRIAEIFSEDSTGYIRGESVNLWIALLKQSKNIKATMVERLTRGSWQKRMVLSKIIVSIGKSGFEDVVELLKNDDIEIIRRFIQDNII